MYRPVQRAYCSELVAVKDESRRAALLRACAPHKHRFVEPARLVLDLCGVRCPLAWAKAKVRLEALARGTEVDLLIDDPRSLRDLPRAAEGSGHHVVAVDAASTPWRITIEV